MPMPMPMPMAMAYALYLYLTLYRPILGLARIVLDSDLVALALRLFAKINYACSMTVPVLMDGYLLS